MSRSGNAEPSGGDPAGGLTLQRDRRGSLVLHCPAKINLTLEVLGRNPDGYHRICSVLQTISLADRLTLSASPEVRLDCDRPALSGPDNLVTRAALLLKDVTGYGGGAHLWLEKRIPEAAGLGGGSSDAAAALRGLNVLWDLGISEEDLSGLAARLGSDVPFFLSGGTALAEGRGEKLTTLPSPGELWLAVARPPIVLPQKTATLYRSLTEANFTRGEHTEVLVRVLRSGQTPPDDLFFNTFEAVAASVYPNIGRHIKRLVSAGGRSTHLAGSGPAIFAVFEDRKAAESVVQRLSGLDAYVACTTPNLQ